nr:type II secretion system protein GspE [Eubacterium sp.]
MAIAGARKKIRIGDLLVEAGAITADELQQALAKQKEEGGRIGNVIMDMGFISRELLITVLTTQMGIDFVELRSIKVDDNVLKMVPEKLVNQHKVFPIGLDEENPNILKLAMADPMDLAAVDDVAISTGMTVEPVLAFDDDIQESIGKYYGSAQAMEAAEAFRMEQASGELTEAEEDMMRDDIENSPIV